MKSKKRKYEDELVPINPSEFDSVLSVEHRNTGILLGFAITALALIISFFFAYNHSILDITIVTVALSSSVSFFVYSLRTRVLALYLTHHESIHTDRTFLRDIWRLTLTADASNEAGLALILVAIFLFLMIIELVIPAVVMMVILNLLFSRWSFQKMSMSVKEKFKARPHTRALISRFRDFTRFMIVFTRVWIPVFMTVYYLLSEYFVILSPYDPYWILLFLVGTGLSIVYVEKTEEEISII
nr:hypothetical protein [Candidatus Freyarchaeota archaeon]